MNKKNTTKKTVKPAYVVDMTCCENADDLKMAFIWAKVDNGVAITTDEFVFAQTRAIINTITVCELANHIMNKIFDKLTPVKKTPWYKRLWNWITCKKN